jgi:hypothetical protein
MYIIIDKNTGKVLYGSAIELTNLPENETAILLKEGMTVTENSIYNFKTETFYEG